MQANQTLEGTPQARGREAEDIAAKHLLRAGVEIIARNLVLEGHELDIVGLDAGCLCFVEVRARKDNGVVDPLETITMPKVRRLRRGAELFLLYHGDNFAWEACRFDVIGITFEPTLELEWRKEAFEAC